MSNLHFTHGAARTGEVTRKRTKYTIEPTGDGDYPYRVRYGKYSRLFQTQTEAEAYVGTTTRPEPRQDWFIVILRRVNDDEDSCYIVQAKNEGAATTRVRNEFRKDNCMPRWSQKQAEREDREGDGVYINYVVQCPGGRPQIVRGVEY